MKSQYEFFGFIKMGFNYILTKLFYRNARLIRFPFDIRNRKLIQIGNGLTTGYGCRIEAHQINSDTNIKIFMGEGIEINDYVHIASGEKIIFGNHVLIASKVFITDINHGIYSGSFQDNPFSIPNKRKLSTSPVIIEDNVWIGESVCIMPGVKIGKGSIIGALSVVTKNIPENSIAVGNPAKVIKIYNSEKKEWEVVPRT